MTPEEVQQAADQKTTLVAPCVFIGAGKIRSRLHERLVTVKPDIHLPTLLYLFLLDPRPLFCSFHDYSELITFLRPAFPEEVLLTNPNGVTSLLPDTNDLYTTHTPLNCLTFHRHAYLYEQTHLPIWCRSDIPIPIPHAAL